MGLRREGRELALKALYLFDLTGLEMKEAFEIVKRDGNFSPRMLAFAQELFYGAVFELNEIDSLIMKYSENWSMERMAAVDKNVLRIGAFELLRMKETPVKVVIDEAIEIARKYSREDSNKFVNGILDKIKDVRETPSDNGG
jgi:N utilization substance protein B